MDEDLAAFPYVNGGLFADSSIIVPQMTSEILEAITDASQDFDWREISGRHLRRRVRGDSEP